ncbi:flavin monoamine oxidase family protein [Longibacter sp.]|uniref:flavin monoamine oxidase family protein n=1 Tax=Longibacter sp. TaxID=2045415 RepID=UPI003EB9CD3C
MPRSPATSADVVVIGGGVAGLLVAHRCAATGDSVLLLEAGERVGGRCLSLDAGGIRVDLGAAWHWAEHTRVPRVLDRFSLARIRQYEPGVAVFESGRNRPVEHVDWPSTPPPSWRIEGGTQALIDAVADVIPDGTVHCGMRVDRIRQAGPDGIRVEGTGSEGPFSVEAARCACAVPPRLVAHTIDIRPLPSGVKDALRHTPTWMSHSLKAGVVYDRPFWREDGWSGRVRSLVGPIHDWHDATPPASLASGGRSRGAGGLFGFGPPLQQGVSMDDFRKRIVEQLVHCYGPAARDPVAVRVQDWSRAPRTTPSAGSACRVDEPTAVPALSREYWNGRLHFVAAETACDHPGFLDGAIEAAQRWEEQTSATASAAA